MESFGCNMRGPSSKQLSLHFITEWRSGKEMHKTAGWTCPQCVELSRPENL